jgi:putative two-component system response regulator
MIHSGLSPLEIKPPLVRLQSPPDKTETRILVVDDSMAARAGMKNMLSGENVHICLAADGQEALGKAMVQPFDAIVTDVHMPVMDGIELCRRIHSMPQTRSIPVIMVSGMDTDEAINQGFSAGAAAFLSKSEISRLLKKTVKESLTRNCFAKQHTILIVDDSSSIRQFVKDCLTNAGYQTLTAENGKTALQLLADEKPGLILSDINMPEMNGFDFHRAIRADPELASIPFVVMSTNKDYGHIARMIRQGAASYIIKPFEMDQLVILLEKVLSDQYLILLKEKERLDTERNDLLNSINSLISALEARDAYTRGHSEAVSKIASGMIAHSGADIEDVEAVAIGGKLHDIGKIGIRDTVLLKPGKLTEEEFFHVKQHPVIGKTILASIESLKSILPIVYSHHERWDGKGYPEGLAVENIPFWARITAVADTFHALTSDRPYRKGLSLEKALQIIEDVKTTQLCPESVDLFFDWIPYSGL